MPSQPTRTRARDATAESANASLEHQGLRAALQGDLAREARFWRARAEELAAQMATLQERLLALTDHLPTRYAQLLSYDPAALERENDWPDPLAGWKETTLLEPASVAGELSLLWKRLGTPPR